VIVAALGVDLDGDCGAAADLSHAFEEERPHVQLQLFLADGRFPEDDCQHAGAPDTLQRPSAGFGAAFRRHYWVRVERPLLSAVELMSIILSDPNVACPLEIARFERDSAASRPVELGEEIVCGCPVHGTVPCALSM
jgi:hypothetical protein